MNDLAALERDRDRWRAHFEQADRELVAVIRSRNAVTSVLDEARLLAELWLRSTDETTRRLGADLKQVLAGGA